MLKSSRTDIKSNNSIVIKQVQVSQKKLTMDKFNAKELYFNLFWSSMCDKLTNISQETNPYFLKNLNARLLVTIMKQIYAFSMNQKKQSFIKDF